MAAEGGGLFNQDYLGESFVWWIGQVADDSYWRDNINAGKFKDKQSVRGWGYRYKVRIFGLHDWGEDSIPSENLPWANVMYPITAGGYQQNSGSTPMIRQGNIVFGFFLDGSEQQQPVIMGVLGNNSQTLLAGKIGDNRVSNTQPGSVATSGYAEGNVDYEGTSAPLPPDKDKGVEKPKDPELAKELADPTPGVSLNQFGLPSNKPISKSQQKDINSARSEISLILESNPAFSLLAQENLIKKRVASGMAARKKEANSPRSPVNPGATIESEAVHVQSSADIKLDEVFCKKRVLLKPTGIVDSCNRAMKTDMDNMTTNIEKAINAFSSYTDAVSITQGVKDLKKVIKDSSKTQSKYMKVIMDKVKEYSQKKINQEMTSAVSALPACKRWQMLDLKDNMTQNILSEFNGMTGGMSGLMEGVLNNMLKLDDYKDNFGNQQKGLLTQALESAFNDSSKGDKEKAKPRVPVCTSEDAIAAVIHSNQTKIEDTNGNILNGIDTFIGDMMNEMGNVGGSAAGITGVLSKLGNIRGNMTSALDFENIKQNVFPFELPPNEAVADYYTFCGGGASQSQSQLPSSAAIQDAVVELKNRVIPDKEPIEVFAEPPKNASNVDLRDAPLIKELF
tara:strand:+ start:2228 stop:4093 length:1866 start_codon:yes stop_codon:yes gene_type:complete